MAAFRFIEDLLVQPGGFGLAYFANNLSLSRSYVLIAAGLGGLDTQHVVAIGAANHLAHTTRR